MLDRIERILKSVNIQTPLSVFVSTIAVFVLMKPVFMFFNGFAERSFTVINFFEVLYHGLPLDFATAGYIASVPWLLSLAGIWVRIPGLRRIYLVYFFIVSVVLGLIFVADTCLYSFWDFKIDATVFNYIDSPKGAMASVSTLYVVTATIAVVVSCMIIFGFLRLSAPRDSVRCPRRFLATLTMLLFGGVLFFFIRGSVGKSTANTGMVYFSNHQFLNHSSVNPVFSIFSMLGSTEDYAEKGNFFDEKKRARLFATLGYNTESIDTDTLLSTPRPNVLIILMEGFGGAFVEAIGGEKGVTPNFNRLSQEGVIFTDCYANSFRTDRGTVCTFSGYPSFPDVSVMKQPEKNHTMPSIAASLKKVGYDTDFLYGGDVNFTNMQSYLRATGYDGIASERNFSIKERNTHAWGVTDKITFDYLYAMISKRDTDKPWHTAFLTLASHEPWEVPYSRIKNNEVANSMAYLDDCLGRFVEKIKRTPQWKNLLIVCLPDHAIEYPEGINETDLRHSHIPVLWIGGAVRKPVRIEKTCNQTDLAATLLGQMKIKHTEFRFSRDVLSKTYTNPFAFHTFSNGFMLKDSAGYSVFDIVSKRALKETPCPTPQRIDAGKALLQTSYDDLGNR